MQPDNPIALEDVLFEAGVLSKEQRDEIKKKLPGIDKPIEQFLVDEKYATPSEIDLAKKSIELGVKCLSLRDTPPDEENSYQKSLKSKFTEFTWMIPLVLGICAIFLCLYMWYTLSSAQLFGSVFSKPLFWKR